MARSIRQKFLSWRALFSLFGVAAAAAVSTTAEASAPTDLPQVDLGYNIHRASKLKDGIYTFRNIRYGAPPVGKLRFSPAQHPATERNTIKDGTGLGDTHCYQSNPEWAVPANGSKAGLDPIKYIANSPGKGSEDCLFLDVIAPAKHFKKTSYDSKRSPVVIWIHGGGWVQLTKNWYGGLDGLVHASGDDTVVVMINYRLAAFGFLNGPSYRRSGGTPNLGLLDQRFAMEWVQKHISKFGGDPSRVTIMGQSAGGGAVIHHVTAYGGNVRNPFKNALSLSPGWNPTTNHLTAEKTYHALAVAAKCTEGEYGHGMPKEVLECLRGKSSEEMALANQAVVAKAAYGAFGFSPSVDGELVPDMATNLLAYGRFDKKLKIMTGQVTDEAHTYTNPLINASLRIPEAVAWAMPQVDPTVAKYLGEKLYPLVTDAGASSLPYKDNYERADLMVSEFGFICNNAALHQATNGNSYGWLFGIPPAKHWDDMVYLFDTLLTTPTIAEGKVSKALRAYVSNFIAHGDPNGLGNAGGLPEFPKYGDKATMLSIPKPDTITVAKDPADNERCRWWQDVLYVN